MSAATSTILTIIGVGAATGGTIYGAKKAGDASKEAATVQGASADKALEVQKQQYEQNRADQERLYQQQRTDEAPYLGLGAGAVGALQYGLGLTPPTPSTAPPAPTITTPGAPVPSTSGAGGGGGLGSAFGGALGGVAKGPARLFAGAPNTAVPTSGPWGALAQRGGVTDAATRAGSNGGDPSGSGVPMRAPNGQIKNVPPDQVAHYQSLGASVV